MRTWQPLAFFAIVLMGSPRFAHAGGDQATAEALFTEGRRLMTAHDYTAACEKFAASQKLDPALGTSLNLADCYEKGGRTASAWAEFRSAAGAARTNGSKDREQVARGRAAALEKQLSRLTLTDKSGGQDLRIVRDGAPVDRAVLGTPVPVDPGAHVIEVAATGKKKWTTRVDVRAGAQLAIEIPPLENEGSASAVTANVSPVGPNESAAPGGSQRIVAIAVGGLGVAGLAVGSIFGLKTMSNWSDAKGHCKNYPAECGDEGVKLMDDARSASTISTIGFAAGIVGVAAGVALWLTVPSSDEKSAGRAPLRVGFDGQKLLVGGTFE